MYTYARGYAKLAVTPIQAQKQRNRAPYAFVQILVKNVANFAAQNQNSAENHINSEFYAPIISPH